MKPDRAPIATVYDIDLLTPIPSPPNPLPADLERKILDGKPESSSTPAAPESSSPPPCPKIKQP